MALATHQEQAASTELGGSTLAAAQAGDRVALRAFVTFYQDRVVRLLHRLLDGTGRNSDVEDLAQDTFLRGLRGLSQFDPQGPARVSTWLLTIATRLAIDTLRTHATRQANHVEPDTLPAANDPAAESDRRRLGAMLVGALRTLSPKQRAVFVLREYDGLDYQAIGKALGIGPGTVASRLSRARAALQAAMTELE